LIALNRLWKLRLKEKDLIGLGIKIGSDVPFFIIGGTALVTGIGDRIKPITRYPKLNYVLVNPGYRVSTESAYNAFDKAKVKPKKPMTDKAVKALANSDVKSLADALSNNFEDVMFKKHKDLKDIREAYFKMKDDYPFVFLTKTI
ncbi:4-(cytidine 5'-diphospho)-2-C-methyl-D-erythritol kinase, partial [Candidatus Woesearchaeota archaeon]|nr:4-(cytidine 5'-diphospho)-2-C-methyl-D-erythritol kinase [Candidatus Woesearchaeota archaeon]